MNINPDRPDEVIIHTPIILTVQGAKKGMYSCWMIDARTGYRVEGFGKTFAAAVHGCLRIWIERTAQLMAAMSPLELQAHGEQSHGEQSQFGWNDFLRVLNGAASETENAQPTFEPPPFTVKCNRCEEVGPYTHCAGCKAKICDACGHFDVTRGHSEADHYAVQEASSDD
jgi:hypothetical protein